MERNNVVNTDGSIDWDKIGSFDTQLAETMSDMETRAVSVLYPPAPLVGAKGDGVTNDRQAIKNIGNAIPAGGTLIFPQTINGYFVENENINDTELFLFTKPINIKGFGYFSHLVLSDNIPSTCDIFRISPNMAYGADMYSFEGMCGHTVTNDIRSARHFLHLDVSGEGQHLARLLIRRNIMYATGGYSIFLSNPINIDGLFASQIESNRLSSGIWLDRGGDSLTLTNNTITGYNGVYVSLVEGANTFVFAFNNVTARGGFILKKGFNCKIIYNNFEVAYADMTLENGAYIDIDGSDEVAKMYVTEFKGNNLTYRSGATIPVNGLRINNARGSLVDGNHISHNGGYMIDITVNSQNAIIGYNTYSFADPEGNIRDLSTSTIKRDVHKPNPVGGRKYYEVIAAEVYREGNKHFEEFNEFYKEGKHDTTSTIHNYTWKETVTTGIKHILRSVKKLASGVLEQKDVLYIDDEKVVFPLIGFGLSGADGVRRRVFAQDAIPITGTYQKGDIIYNTSPSAGGKVGWICITTGTPGTWKPFGAIDA